jgi:glycosyltransferase involved in cell wall biosynthesis
MRVVHIITRMIVGGAQENTLLSVAGLRQRHGVDAWLLTGPQTGPEGNLLGRPAAAGVPVVTIRTLVREIAPVRDLLALVSLWWALRRLRPDVVHTHSGKAGILGRLAAFLAGVPRVIHTLHGSPEFRDERSLPRFAYRFAERCLSRLTDDLVGVCAAMVEQAQAMGLRPRRGFHVVYSGFDVDAFAAGARELAGQAIRRRFGIPPSAFVVATVARLAPLKGHLDLIRAAERLADPSLWLLVVGDGPMRGALESAAREAGLGGRVAWAGLVPPEAVPAHLAAADCVVHASYREGLARVIPQAFLARRPVVAYLLDGAPELVIPEATGWGVPPGDVGALAQAVRAVAEDPAQARVLAEAGARRVAGSFRAEAMVDALADLYAHPPRGGSPGGTVGVEPPSIILEPGPAPEVPFPRGGNAAAPAEEGPPSF